MNAENSGRVRGQGISPGARWRRGAGDDEEVALWSDEGGDVGLG